MSRAYPPPPPGFTVIPPPPDGFTIVSDNTGVVASAPEPDTLLSRAKRAQASKFPTAQEQGAAPGTAMTGDTLRGRATDAPMLTRLAGGFAEMADVVHPMLGAIRHPIDTAVGMQNAQMGQFQKAVDAPSWSEKIGHGLAAAIPIAGPIAAGMGEQAASGDVAGMLGGAAALAAPGAAAKVAEVAAEPLAKAASGQYYRAMNPTKEVNKIKTLRTVPRLLEEKMTGSLESMRGKTGAKADIAGKARELIIKNSQAQVDTNNVIAAIEKSKMERNAIVPGENGMVTVDPAYVGKADELKAIVQELGPNVSAESLDAVKQRWGKIVSKAGGYDVHTSTLGTAAEAYRDAERGIATELHKSVPDLGKVDAEYTFWRKANDVIGDTIKRKTGQGEPLGQQLLGNTGTAAGMVHGFMSGGLVQGGVEAIGLSLVVRGIGKMVKSGTWRTVAAVTKNEIAKLMARGEIKTAAKLVTGLEASSQAVDQRR